MICVRAFRFKKSLEAVGSVCGTHTHTPLCKYIHKIENDQTVESISLVVREKQYHHCWSHTDKQASCINGIYKIKLELLVMSEIITFCVLKLVINIAIKFLGSFKFLLS